MKTIWKFELRSPFAEDFDSRLLRMPYDAMLLDCQMQGAAITVWAVVDLAELMMPRRFLVYPNGGTRDPQGVYLATVQQGALVWHVFDGGYE